jgi:hypothetical protein
MNNKDIAGKTFIGYVLDIKDPAGLGRKAVYIPNLLKSTIAGEKYVFCKEAINTYVRARNPLKSNYPYFSYGSYQPILPGTKVLVTFVNNSLESGYIIGIDATVKEPFAEGEWLVFKTPKGSEFYINDDNNVCHIKNANGKTNLYMTDTDIYLQVNQIDENAKAETDLKAQSYIQISPSFIQLKIGDTLYRFGENGINFSSGSDSLTAFEMTKDTITINANKNITISTDEGNLNLSGQYTYISGYTELHAYGNDARFTGAQKAQISGNTVALWGWMDAHVKGMHVGIDAWIQLDVTSLIKNEENLAMHYSLSSLTARTSAIDVTSCALKAESYSLKGQDGVVISNLGVGSGVSSSVGTSLSTVATGIKFSLMGINTFFLMSDPFTGAATQVLTMTLAGAANSAIGSITPVGSGISKLDHKNSVIATISMRSSAEENSKKYILPDKLSL